MNILRAEDWSPLQFTEYTQVTALSSLTGQVSGQLPVATVPANAGRTWLVNPQVSGNAQTNMVVQNLNSQEFYYGLQTPLVSAH